MTTLLLVDDTCEGRKEYFESNEEYEAIECLKKWCLEVNTHEVFLTEVGPGIDRRIDSGHEIFTSTFEIRAPDSRDIWCTSCGFMHEAMNDEDIDRLPIKKIINEREYGTETLYTTPCTVCIGYMIVNGTIIPKSSKRRKNK